MAIKTYGTMAVDWERRIDFERLRRERLARIKKLLADSELGSVLCFDMNNVRYITSTHIGTWAQDKISRFTLLPQNDEPILWDFGSAAKHHRLYCDWLGERSRAGIPLMRGAMTPEMGRSEDVARKIDAVQSGTGEAVTAITGIREVMSAIDGLQASLSAAIEQQAAASTGIARSVGAAAEGSSVAPIGPSSSRRVRGSINDSWTSSQRAHR